MPRRLAKLGKTLPPALASEPPGEGERGSAPLRGPGSPVQQLAAEMDRQAWPEGIRRGCLKTPAVRPETQPTAPPVRPGSAALTPGIGRGVFAPPRVDHET